MSKPLGMVSLARSSLLKSTAGRLGCGPGANAAIGVAGGNVALGGNGPLLSDTHGLGTPTGGVPLGTGYGVAIAVEPGIGVNGCWVGAKLACPRIGPLFGLFGCAALLPFVLFLL